MQIQQSMEQLEEQLQGQDGPRCATKYEQHLLLSLWKLLQGLSEQYPSLLLLPCIERGEWKCEAILLSHRGIYVFHLLPTSMIEVDIKITGIKVICSDRENGDNHPTDEILYSFGKSRMMLESIQHQLGWSPLPVYEFYIASEHHQDVRCVVDGMLIISISQLDDLFSHYEFRPYPNHENRQKELYHNLTQSIKDADLEISRPLQNDLDYSSISITSESSAIPDPQFEIQSEPKLASNQTLFMGTLPPRQSRKKKQGYSWLNKFFNG